MDESPVHVIGEIGAAWTSLLPLRTEHEVIDDKLTAPIEQAGEAHVTVRTIEHIILLDLDPGQVAPRRRQRVAHMREGLLALQELPARIQPFALRNDLGHHLSLHPWRPAGAASRKRPSSPIHGCYALPRSAGRY